MTIIIGFGNTLRGEDGFGVDVINELQNYSLINTKLISTFQLTPEISLELKEANKLIFVDASFSEESYKLACSLETLNTNKLSHHIKIVEIISILENLYNCKPYYEVFSMLTKNFDEIVDKNKYKKVVKEVASFIANS